MATQNACNFSKPIEVANGGTSAATFTANSLLLGNTTSAITALGAATNGQLPIGSTAASPVLAAITAGAGAYVTNAAGSITVGSLGQLVLIQSQTAAAVATLSFTTGITNAYNTYFFLVSNAVPSANGANIELRVSNDGGGSYAATGYLGGQTIFNYDSTTLIQQTDTIGIRVINGASNAAGTRSGAHLWCNNITNGQQSMFNGESSLFFVNAPNTRFGKIHGSGPSATVTINAFRFLPSSGTFSGVFTLYGVKET